MASLPSDEEAVVGVGQTSLKAQQASGGPPALVHTIKQLATLEATIWSILEGMQSNATYVAFFCREYWGSSASKAQTSLERLDWSDRLKCQVQRACVLECLSLALASHLCSGTMQDVSVPVRSRLRSLIYYIHENCLVLIDLLRQRLEAVSDTPVDMSFEIFVRVNRYRSFRNGQHVMALRQHSDMIANVLRQLCRGRATKEALPRGRGGAGDHSPGSPTKKLSRAPGRAKGAFSAVSDILAASTPLERLRPRALRMTMLQQLRFQPLLSGVGDAEDCRWPMEDPFERFGTECFAVDGPTIWFEPLPPMMADLERSPTLPPAPTVDAYTLVLDLDETLVHYFEVDGQGRFGCRPGMTEFLQSMSDLGYELVIFTAATQDYADWVIGEIDPDGLIHHRLYRQNALPWGPLFAKDLCRLGRDMERTLIIDNVQENFMFQPDNGIFISTWYDDPYDAALPELTPLLEELITTRAKVPEILDKYREEIPVWAGFGQFCEGADGCLEDALGYEAPMEAEGALAEALPHPPSELAPYQPQHQDRVPEVLYTCHENFPVQTGFGQVCEGADGLEDALGCEASTVAEGGVAKALPYPPKELVPNHSNVRPVARPPQDSEAAQAPQLPSGTAVVNRQNYRITAIRASGGACPSQHAAPRADAQQEAHSAVDVAEQSAAQEPRLTRGRFVIQSVEPLQPRQVSLTPSPRNFSAVAGPFQQLPCSKPEWRAGGVSGPCQSPPLGHQPPMPCQRCAPCLRAPRPKVRPHLAGFSSRHLLGRGWHSL